MEIKINIPKNDYAQPAEVRQDVVQGICEAFLDGGSLSIFHPYSASPYRKATRHILRRKNSITYYGFDDVSYTYDEAVRFNGAEMKAAFKVLREAGYHIFKRYCYGSWLGYVVDRKPFRQDATEVYEFNDFID